MLDIKIKIGGGGNLNNFNFNNLFKEHLNQEV